MLYIWSGNLKEGKEEEFKAWVRRSHEEWNSHAAPGWRLKGFHTRAFTVGRYDFSMIWEFDKFADFDSIDKHLDPVYDRLENEMSEFIMPGCGEAWILRDVVP